MLFLAAAWWSSRTETRFFNTSFPALDWTAHHPIPSLNVTISPMAALASMSPNARSLLASFLNPSASGGWSSVVLKAAIFSLASAWAMAMDRLALETPSMAWVASVSFSSSSRNWSLALASSSSSSDRPTRWLVLLDSEKPNVDEASFRRARVAGV